MDRLDNLASFRVRLGRIADIDIFVHWTLIALSAFFLYQFWDDPKLGFLLLMGAWTSILLHELGHCWGARRVGGEAHEVILWPLGGLAMVRAPLEPWPQFFTTLTGPLVNVLIALACLPLFVALGGELAWLLPWGPAPVLAGLGLSFIYYLVALNLFLVFFNAIPAYPLDGGRMFQTLLWPHMGFQRSLQVTIAVAFVCFALLGVYAIMTKSMLLGAIVVFGVLSALRERENLRYGAYDDMLGAQESPWAPALPSYDDEKRARPAPQPSRYARWKEKRRRQREEELRQQRAEMRIRLDEILAKVSTRGMDGLTKEERRFLDRASHELRKEQSGLS